MAFTAEEPPTFGEGMGEYIYIYIKEGFLECPQSFGLFFPVPDFIPNNGTFSHILIFIL